MSKISAIVLVIPVALMTTIANATSDGCDTDPLVFPGPTTPTVPTNTRVWISRFGCDDFGLIDGLGGDTSVDHEVLEAKSGASRVLTPHEPLTDGEEYRLVCDHQPTTFTFVVNSGPDIDRPDVPAMTPTDEGGGSVLQATGGFDVLLVDIGSVSSFDEAGVSGDVSAVFYDSALAIIGRAECFANHDFDENEAPEVRFAALDLAGNFSGWSEPIVVEAPGCTTADTATAARNTYGLYVVLAALIGAATRRRRR